MKSLASNGGPYKRKAGRLERKDEKTSEAKCQQHNGLSLVLCQQIENDTATVYIHKHTEKITFNWIPFRTNEHCSDKVFQLNGGWFCFHANRIAPPNSSFERWFFYTLLLHTPSIPNLHLCRTRAPRSIDGKAQKLITQSLFGGCRQCDNFDSFR